ncbi:YfbU family protein [Paraburkholderia sp. EG286B]|uniref:YfbU family protein n=1 Tax=Paraburkholderia sp. EG286B TaxID=3237011 RepID=UPI0034D222E0
MSNAEKLITIMLCEIQEHLKMNGEVDAAFVKDAILDDHLWGIEWQYPGLFGDGGREPTPPEVSFVADVLDMWTFVERGYANLAAGGKARVDAEAAPFAPPRFEGFDGNNETEYMSIARFLVEKLDRFTNFKGRAFNSHMPSIGRHRQMLEIFDGIRADLGPADLSADQLISILTRRGA